VSLWTGSQRIRVATCPAPCRMRTRLHASVSLPPADYDVRADCQEASAALVAERFPSLIDLVEDGSLIALRRPDNYAENRTDGFQEPELVLVLGTAHMSTKSASDVRRVIQATSPNSVVVELCKERAGAMYSEEGESPTDYIARLPMQERIKAWAQLIADKPLLLLLTLLQQGVYKQLGVTSGGGEFRAARIAAEEVGAALVLGDRRIKITLSRTFKALRERVLQIAPFRGSQQQQQQQQDQVLLDTRQKAMGAGTLGVGTLAASLPFNLAEAFGNFRNNIPQAASSELTQDWVESLKAGGTSTSVSLMNELGIAGPFIHERDLYLAWTLTRSRAVSCSNIVVGVVGLAHLRGIAYTLKSYPNGALKYRDLPGLNDGKGKGSSWQGGILKGLAVLAVQLGMWQIVIRPFLQPLFAGFPAPLGGL